MTLEEAQQHLILMAVMGSHAVGLNLPTSDQDLTGICIEPIEHGIGLRAPFEQAVRTKPDITIYSLRKFVSLALKGNPTILNLLYARETVTKVDARGSRLQELAPHIVSRRAAPAYLGYLQAQKKRLLGERGNGGHGLPRQDLIDAYGFDTKFAMHMLRLGIQGVELLTTGKLTLPLPPEARGFLLNVRQGLVPLADCLTHAVALEQQLKDLSAEGSPLPEAPDEALINDWLINTYFRTWSATYGHKDALQMATALAAQAPDLPRMRKRLPNMAETS